MGRHTVRGVMVIGLAGATLFGCGSGDDPAGTPTTSEAAPTTTGPVESAGDGVSTTTSVPEPAGTPGVDPCAVVTDADLAGLGAGERIDGELDLDPTVASVACRWPIGGAELTLVIETPAFSDVFELAAADPAAEDPEQISGLGDQAAYADILGGGGATANWLVVRSGDVVFRLAGTDRGAVGRDRLVSVGRVVLGRVIG